MPLLSFVIPTLNFAAFLPDTLDSIVDEGFGPIEILVFDGGSSDNTLDVLERYRAKFPALRVLTATERGNIDIDLNQAVDAAAGEYIWTMSADDALLPGWSKDIVARLAREHPDLMLVPAVHGDIDMRPRRNYPILRDSGGTDLIAKIADDHGMLSYLRQVRTSEGLFSFCSACIVRRDRLALAPKLEQANGTCWRYSARLIAVLAQYPTTIVVMGKPLILKRGDNDSFASAGVIRRLKIATVNWDEAIGHLALRDRIGDAIRTLAKADIRPATLLYFSQFVRDREERLIYGRCVQARLGEGGASDRMMAWMLRRLPQLRLLKNGFVLAKHFVRKVQQRRWAAALPQVVQNEGLARE